MNFKHRIIFLSGRFGNVLLQIQFGKYLEQNYNVNCFYNCIFLDNNLVNTILKLYGDYLTNKLFCIRHYKGCSLFYFALLRKINIWPFYVEPDIDVIVESNKIKKYICFTGYFQNYSYGNTLLFKQSNLKNLVSSENLERTSHLSKSDVVLHMRFGDYIDKKGKNYYSNLGMTYYINALKYFSNIKRVIVITDNVKLVSMILPDNINYNIEIWSSNTYTYLDDFYTMTSSYNLIIANSSFSYSAALQGSRIKKMTILAPKNWFASRSINQYLRFPNSWIAI